MRISIFGINFAPETTGIGPYTSALADHLARRHAVTVFTGVPHYPHWSVPEEWRSWRTTVETRDSGATVHHSRHFVPARQDALRRAAYEITWAGRAAWESARVPADLVIAVVPALFGAVSARLRARLGGIPLGIVVQDVMSTAASQSGILGGQWAARSASYVEAQSLRSAAGIVTIHPRLAAILSSSYDLPAPPRVIYNWSHIVQATDGESELIRKGRGWQDSGRFIVLHSGNMGMKQDLGAVVHAARLADERDLPIHFVLAGGGSQFAALRRDAATVPNLDVVEGVPADAFPAFLGAADALLVHERPGMTEMSLPSKLTSYFTTGVPVIAATDPDSTTASFIRDSGAGELVPSGDPAALLHRITELAADRERSRALGARARAFAAERLSEDAALAAYDDWVETLVQTCRT